MMTNKIIKPVQENVNNFQCHNKTLKKYENPNNFVDPFCHHLLKLFFGYCVLIFNTSLQRDISSSAWKIYNLTFDFMIFLSSSPNFSFCSKKSSLTKPHNLFGELMDVLLSFLSFSFDTAAPIYHFRASVLTNWFWLMFMGMMGIGLIFQVVLIAIRHNFCLEFKI